MESDPNHVLHVQQLFIRNSGLLRGFVGALFPDFDLADDILQEVFVVITEKAEAYRPGTNFTAWACEIAKRKALEAARKHRRSPGVLSPETIETLCAAAPLEEAVSERTDLRQCVGKLAPKTRQIVKLRYRQGIKPGEIAQRMNWTPQAVYVALSRARSFLRECLGRQASAGEI